jgi:hypothetical protein
MEDIVALRVVVDKGPNQYFLTWGRLLDRVETKSLEQLVGSHLSKFALGGPAVSISVCDSLREAAGARYFYECFFAMCQKPIPFGDGYKRWAAQMLAKLKEGREIYYLGAEAETSSSRPRT